MLNEERVILMTRMAVYENGEGRKNGAIGSYFRGDYIGLQVLKSVISATISFVLVCAVLVLYNFDGIMDSLYGIDLFVAVKKVIIAYVVVVAVYALVSYLIYSFMYKKARKKQKAYASSLRRLSEMYQREAKNKQ